MMKIVMVLAGALVLQGCVSAKEQANEDDQICLGYGLQRGSPQYIDCRRSIMDDRRAREESRNRLRSIQSLGDSLVKASEKNKPQPRPQNCRFVRQADGWDRRVCS
jgi:hypothetical protein